MFYKFLQVVSVWPNSRVFGGYCDFVLCDYMDHVVVVCCDICGCYA